MRGSFMLALITNTLSPNGGVSKPISIAIVVMMPNQTRFAPSAVETGNASGSMISMIDVESSSVPSTSSSSR